MTVRWTHYRVFVVAVVFATLGFVAGTAWTAHTMKPDIEALAATVEQCLGTGHQPAEGQP